MNDIKLSAAMSIRHASGFGRTLAKASAPKSKSGRAASNGGFPLPGKSVSSAAGFTRAAGEQPAGAAAPVSLHKLILPGPWLVRCLFILAVLALLLPIAAYLRLPLIVAAALLILAATLDLLRSRREFRPLEIELAAGHWVASAASPDPEDANSPASSVLVPSFPLVRLRQHQAGSLDWIISGLPAGRRLRLRLAIGAMDAGTQEALGLSGEPKIWNLAAASDSARRRLRVRTLLTPLRRGSYSGLCAAIETESRWRLWRLRRRFGLRGCLRVYPDLRGARRQLLRSRLYYSALGARPQLTGQGRDYERLREYLPGDPYSDLSWKATARRGHPVVRVFQWERLQPLLVVLDHSRLAARRQEWNVPAMHPLASGKAAAAEPLLEAYLRAALLASETAVRLGDQVGLACFAGELTHFLTPGIGSRALAACRRILVGLSAEHSTPDYPAVCAALAAALRRRSLLLWLTDCAEPALAPELMAGFDLLRQRHVVVVSSPLPAAVAPLFGRDSGVRSSAAAQAQAAELAREGSAAIYRRLAGHREYVRLLELRRRLERRGVALRWARSDLELSAVETYLEAKRNQRL